MYTINDLFQIGSELDPSVLLKEANSTILLKQENKSKLEELEKFLTSLFYGEGRKNKYFQKILNENITKYLDNKMENIDKNIQYSLSSNKVGIISTDVSGKIELTDYVSYSHKKYIEQKTIQARLGQVESKLEDLKKKKVEGLNEKELEDLKNGYKNLLDQLEKLEKENKEQEKIYINDQNKELIDNIDGLYEKLTYHSSLPISENALGGLFERALQAAAQYVNKNSKQTIEKLVGEAFGKETLGENIVNRGKLKDINIIGKNQSELKIQTVFSDKQGKMDIQLDLPDISSFNISAKNWNVFKNKDFGNVFLFDALIRSSQDYGQTMGYGLQMVGGMPWKLALHQWARLCILLDSLAGYSQKNNYADTIVINDRGSKRIRVYSISNIINNYYKKGSNQYIIGYNDDRIPEILSKGIEKGRPLGPQLANLQGKMREVNLKVSAGILNLT